MSERTVEILDDTCTHKFCEDKDTYLSEVRCYNCGWEGHQRTTCGHEVRSGRSLSPECPRCEVRDLHKVRGGFVRRESSVRVPSSGGEAR